MSVIPEPDPELEPTPETESEPEFDTDYHESTRVQFGRELRKYRTLSGFTQRRLCLAVPLAISHLSMLENGHRAPTRKLAHQIDEALNLGTALVDLLDRLDRMTTQVPRWFRSWLEFEPRAEALHMWELSMIPGLMQVEGYARALIGNEPDSTPEQTDKRVAARLERQEILRRPKPPKIWAVLDESILHRPVGSPEVMKFQLQHLLELGKSSHISLHLLPYTAYSTVGLLGSFVIADMPEGQPSVAYIDSQSTGDRVTERVAEVKELALRHNEIRADALSRRESLKMIKEAIPRWTT
ncbi:helix-turn-helix transcriptional regulator [Streptosporangium sp. NPDC049078]|uniref:helix-turn-helix domain-containing protein n=1 Tax=Streptosporangium sp. NPDC049078 TaxID=3155767 RepID=UPI003438EF63